MAGGNLANSFDRVKTRQPTRCEGRRRDSNIRGALNVKTGMTMTRVRKHLLPRRRIAERLRRAGYSVATVSPTQGYDLLVNDRVRVALRVAFPRPRKHHVTVRGRHYTYRYRSWHFNFHHHGKFGKRYTDMFICLAMEPRNPSREEIFIIPWDAISGKTFSLHAAKKRYGGQYAQHLNRWSAIATAVDEHQPARLRKVA